MAGYTRADPQRPINACSHHPPLPKLGVIKPLNLWAENVPAKDEDWEKRDRAHQEHPRNMWLPGISFKYKKQREKTKKSRNTRRSSSPDCCSAVSEKPAEALPPASPSCPSDRKNSCWLYTAVRNAKNCARETQISKSTAQHRSASLLWTGIGCSPAP